MSFRWWAGRQTDKGNEAFEGIYPVLMLAAMAVSGDDQITVSGQSVFNQLRQASADSSRQILVGGDGKPQLNGRGGFVDVLSAGSWRGDK